MVEQQAVPIQTTGAIEGDGMIEDPNVYSAGEEGQQDIFNTNKALAFSVRDPQDSGGHIVYNVKGVDLQGEFEGLRRYNEFFVLQEALSKRWPGIAIPLTPPKKAVGNKDTVFLQERRFYLERFIRKLARYDFIINGQEFQIFARPQGLDIEKSLNKLPRLSSSQLYDRLKEATATDDSEITDADRDYLETQLTEFQVYVKKADPFLKKMKEELAGYLSKKQIVIQSVGHSAKVLNAYEDNNLSYYCDTDAERLVFQEAGPDLHAQMLKASESLRNPFTDLYHWIKGELYDLNAFVGALNERKATANAVKDLEKKIAQAKTDIASVNDGKKTMNTLFKSSNDVGTMTNKLESYERDLEAQKKLLDILSIYLGKSVMPNFKLEKMKLYGRIVQQMHVIEIGNNHQMASFWANVLKNDSVKQANLIQVEQ